MPYDAKPKIVIRWECPICFKWHFIESDCEQCIKSHHMGITYESGKLFRKIDNLRKKIQGVK